MGSVIENTPASQPISKDPSPSSRSRIRRCVMPASILVCASVIRCTPSVPGAMLSVKVAPLVSMPSVSELQLNAAAGSAGVGLALSTKPVMALCGPVKSTRLSRSVPAILTDRLGAVPLATMRTLNCGWRTRLAVSPLPNTSMGVMRSTCPCRTWPVALSPVCGARPGNWNSAS